MSRCKCSVTKMSWFLTLLLCCMFCTALPVYAKSDVEYSDSTSVTNQGRVGAVDISLEQSFPEEEVVILPNQTVEMKSSVVNHGQPAWIRVKIEYPVDEESLTDDMQEPLLELNDDLISFANESWVKLGSYYYLKEALANEAEMPFTDAITFPADWDNRMVKSKFGVVLTAEAIQEKNFTPDFESEDPWNGAVIEAFDSENYQPKVEGDDTFSVVYKDGAEGLIHVGDDFFLNWGDVMPGDELSGVATIRNQMNIPVKIFFETKSDGSKELLDAILLQIMNGDDVVYDGPLSGEISPKILLKEYETDMETEFKYHLSVPAELNNTYAMSEFQVLWTFSAEEVPQDSDPQDGPGVRVPEGDDGVSDLEPESPEKPKPEEPEPPKEPSNPVEKLVKRITESIDTGDVPLMCVLGVAGVMLLVLIVLTCKAAYQKKGGKH